MQNCHQVDNRVMPCDQRGESGWVMDIYLQHIDHRQQLDALRVVTTARGHRDAQVQTGEFFTHVATYKTCAT